jgi:hypothetical protein
MLALPKGGWCCHYLLSVARLDDIDGSLTWPADKGGDPFQKGVGMAPAGASEADGLDTGAGPVDMETGATALLEANAPGPRVVLFATPVALRVSTPIQLNGADETVGTVAIPVTMGWTALRGTGDAFAPVPARVPSIAARPMPKRRLSILLMWVYPVRCVVSKVHVLYTYEYYCWRVRCGVGQLGRQ